MKVFNYFSFTLISYTSLLLRITIINWFTCLSPDSVYHCRRSPPLLRQELVSVFLSVMWYKWVQLQINTGESNHKHYTWYINKDNQALSRIGLGYQSINQSINQSITMSHVSRYARARDGGLRQISGIRSRQFPGSGRYTMMINFKKKMITHVTT